MTNYAEYFTFEKQLLAKFLYRIKNEHKSTMIYRKTIHLHRLIKKIDTKNVTKTELQVIQQCCIDLYTLTTSYIALGHYLGFTYVILGLSSRFHFLVGKLYNKKEKKIIQEENEIDEIFR